MNRLAAPFLAFTGLLAVTLLATVMLMLTATPPAPPPPLPTNMELLGSVTTVVRQDDPLVAELKADDKRRALETRDDFN